MVKQRNIIYNTKASIKAPKNSNGKIYTMYDYLVYIVVNDSFQ